MEKFHTSQCQECSHYSWSFTFGYMLEKRKSTSSITNRFISPLPQQQKNIAPLPSCVIRIIFPHNPIRSITYLKYFASSLLCSKRRHNSRESQEHYDLLWPIFIFPFAWFCFIIPTICTTCIVFYISFYGKLVTNTTLLKNNVTLLYKKHKVLFLSPVYLA